jgi:hypothetical protein
MVDVLRHNINHFRDTAKLGPYLSGTLSDCGHTLLRLGLFAVSELHYGC